MKYSSNKPESFQAEKNEPIFSILSILKLLDVSIANTRITSLDAM